MSFLDQLSFLAPGWLWAAAAILLPIFLHFLSRGEQRRVQVGSVHRFGAAASRRARRPRITQWLLLLLRCCLLITLACALAQPRLWSIPDPETHAEPLVFYLGSGSAEERLAEDRHGGPWSLLAEADLREPPGVPFEISVVDSLREFTGRRPTLQRPFTWTNLPPPTSTSLSTSTSTSSSEEVRQLSVDLRSHVSRREDARFFRAALTAVAAEEGIEIDDEGADLLVHLSPEPLDEADCVDARLVVSDGTARFSTLSSAPRDFLGLGQIKVQRLYEAEPTEAAALARDGHGRPLLSLSRCGEAAWIRFHSRFHPSASTFVLDPVFPRWIRSVLKELIPAGIPQDLSISPQEVPHQGPASTAPRPHDDLEQLLWVLTLALFFAERLVSRFGESA